MPPNPPNAARPGASTRAADRLLAEGRIRRDQYDAAVAYTRRTGDPVEDALIEIDAISEAELLKHLAGVHKTRFVSTDKLSKAVIDRPTLEKVPRKIAERYSVVPVLFDAAAASLSVVIGDPDNVEALDEVRKAARVRDVKALVARPAAVRAAVRKLYGGETYAFSSLERGGLSLSISGGGVHGSTTLDPDLMGPGADAQGTLVGAFSQGATRVASGAAVARAVATMSEHPVLEIPDAAAAIPPSPAVPASSPLAATPALAPRTSHAAPAQTPASPARHPSDPGPRRSAPPAEPITISDPFIETLNVLVSLLDNHRPELRAHSGVVARLIKKLAERVGLAPPDAAAIIVAAHLHDLGKMGAHHLTALSVADSTTHRTFAQKAVFMPRRLMEHVPLVTGTLAALDSFYEHWDGNGVPGKLAGKDIPIGARMLAIVDSFADLTHNPQNSHQRNLQPVEACDVLAMHKGSVFDPQLLDMFRAMVAGDDLRARLLADRRITLLVDPDPVETTALELRLIEEGYDVRVARSTEQALAELAGGDIHLVASEIDFGDDEPDGLALLADVRGRPTGHDLPWLIVTRRQGRAEAERAFQLGVVDYIVKPTVTEVLVAKVRQALESQAAKRTAAKPTRGVSGSLQEMALPDLIQVLWHGRKSGSLQVTSDGRNGEIFFADGGIVDAVWGDMRGEEAFYALVRLQKGEFSLDPEARAVGEPAIRSSPEALLLEGMRRMDEGV